MQLLPGIFDCLIFEGSAIVHIRSTSYVQIFAEFAGNVLMAFMKREFQELVLFDIPGSLKYSIT